MVSIEANYKNTNPLQSKQPKLLATNKRITTLYRLMDIRSQLCELSDDAD